MLGMFELSLLLGLIAGSVSYVLAYERARLSMSSRQARRSALGATPGPVMFYVALGIVVSFAVPYFVEH